jgi:hypothetical protein
MIDPGSILDRSGVDSHRTWLDLDQPGAGPGVNPGSTRRRLAIAD